MWMKRRRRDEHLETREGMWIMRSLSVVDCMCACMRSLSACVRVADDASRGVFACHMHGSSCKEARDGWMGEREKERGRLASVLLSAPQSRWRERERAALAVPRHSFSFFNSFPVSPLAA